MSWAHTVSWRRTSQLCPLSPCLSVHYISCCYGQLKNLLSPLACSKKCTLLRGCKLLLFVWVFKYLHSAMSLHSLLAFLPAASSELLSAPHFVLWKVTCLQKGEYYLSKGASSLKTRMLHLQWSSFARGISARNPLRCNVCPSAVCVCLPEPLDYVRNSRLLISSIKRPLLLCCISFELANPRNAVILSER